MLVGDVDKSHLGEQRVDKAVPTEGYPGLRADMVPPVGYVVQVGCVKCITAIVQGPLAPWGTKPWEMQFSALPIYMYYEVGSQSTV